MLEVYDYTGRLVTQLPNQNMESGEHSVEFQQNGIASGVYFYRMRAGEFTETRKMMIKTY